MDNITHSLAGLLLAGAAVQLRMRLRGAVADASADASFARTATFTGIVGANLPDIDVLWSAVLERIGVYDRLLSLLHHRGYTHTLLAALVGVPLLWSLALYLRRWQLRRGDDVLPARAGERGWLLALATAAILSHLALDFTNDYGVHPFSPFVNAWTYGDSVFIVEPWLWVVSVPMLLRARTQRLPRLMLWGVLLAGLSLSWVVPQVSMPAAVIVTLGAATAVLLSRRVSPHATALPAIAAWVVVTVIFASGMRIVRTQVRAAVASALADSSRGYAIDQDPRLVEVLVSPSPGNPLCARVITIETTRDEYRLSTAWGSAAPSLVTAAWCSRAAQTDTARGALNLLMTRATSPRTPAVAWEWSWSAPRAELARLAKENCQVAGWLRFARAPFWTAAGADSVRVGDLRYDRDRASVARFTFASRPERCPVMVPPWVRPRAGVLQMDGVD